MKIHTYLIIILLAVFYLIVPLILILFVKNAKIKKFCNILYCVVFCIILFVGVFFKVEISKSVTQINVDFSQGFFNKKFNFKFWSFDLQDFIINILMLFPFGYVFNEALKTKHKCLFSLLFGLMIGTFIELNQFILPIPRSPQLSDIIFNGLSVFIGSVFFVFVNFLIQKITKNKDVK